MVNPIAASSPAPTIALQPTPSGKEAQPRRVANQEKTSTPMGFPKSNPRKTPAVIGFSTLLPPPKETPALKKAKIGSTKNATHGCSACSSRWRGALGVFQYPLKVRHLHLGLLKPLALKTCLELVPQVLRGYLSLYGDSHGQ